MSARRRLLLPMSGHVRGKRSPVTCELKCANACVGEVCNTSPNTYFRDIVASRLSRRSALGLGLAGAVTLLFAGAPAPRAAAGVAGAARVPSPLGFAPIAPVDALEDVFTVPEGFAWLPLIRWGDPLFTESPAFDVLNQTAEAQTLQFGYNCDYTDILVQDGSLSALLFVNHEYTNENIMFPADQLAGEPERVRGVGRAAHGLSVVELQRPAVDRPWNYVVGAPRNRRFLIDTEYAFTGPAAGDELLRTVADPTGLAPLGTLGNCSGGTTPWGTILSGEENFNGYFRSAGTSASDRRYGLTDAATVRGWEADDPRFDTRNAGYENETNRFGWIVEVDPSDPNSVPRKHTSLGRFKHEGANVQIAANGHVVAYSGDDERFDYLYKFVSAQTYREGDRAHNLTLLESGDLYVAQFTGDSPVAEIDGSGTLPADGGFDGTGRWLPLVVAGESQVEGFTVAQVLINTRLAADVVGATKMDRCEDVQPNPFTGKVYVACTNNTNRGRAGYAAADEANPRTQNRDGHIVEITEDRGDQTATSFQWNLLLVAGDPSAGTVTYFGGFPVDLVSPISCPDNLAFDSVGNLWISTDGAPSTIGYNDGLFKVTLEGAERGKVEQFLSVPRDAETCGPVIHDAEQHVFVAVQHPGEDGTFEEPTSLWPDYVPATTPPALRRAAGALAARAELAPGTFRGPRPSIVQVLPASQLLPVVPPTTPPPSTPEPTSSASAAPSNSATAAPTPTTSASSAVSAPTTGAPTSATGRQLSNTGLPVLALAGGAAALLATGGAAAVAARRRSTPTDRDRTGAVDPIAPEAGDHTDH